MSLHPCGCISECEGSCQGTLHISVCVNRLRFWAAAVVNDASQELVHGVPIPDPHQLMPMPSEREKLVRDFPELQLL
jgi:hypothetical protein